MAYSVRNRSVLDLRPSTGIGVALPFDSPGVFRTVYTTKDQIKYNLINFLLTDRRERIFNPSFGANIRSRLFEQITPDTFDTLDTQIRSGIEQYFKNVVITDLTFEPDPDRNLITIQFSYLISNTGESDNVILNLNG
jgi:phage baseplate assembly protein W